MKSLTTVYLSGGCFLLGLLWYAVYSEKIIIRVQRPAEKNASLFIQKTVPLFFYVQGRCRQEMRDILWDDSDQAVNFSRLMHAWVQTLSIEGYAERHCSVESAMIDQITRTVYVSFNILPFSMQGSIYTKWQCAEALLKTIRISFPMIERFQFLESHRLPEDPHLDLSFPWPIQGFLRS